MDLLAICFIFFHNNDKEEIKKVSNCCDTTRNGRLNQARHGLMTKNKAGRFDLRQHQEQHERKQY